MEDHVGDLLIENGRIAAHGDRLSPDGAEVIPADGLWLLPGLVDIHAHLREPGAENKETIASGARAAAAGGITSVVCMADTDPPIENRTGVEFILERAKETGCVHIYPVGALTKGMKGEELAPIGEMVDAGAIAITDDGCSVMDSYVMMRAMQYSTIWDVPIISHCEDRSLTAGAHINEGLMSTTLGVYGWPREAEIIQVARDLLLAKKTGAHLHIAHISCADSVDLIRYYKAKGVNVSCDTAPHYLLLTDEAVDRFDANAKTSPPLRGAEDQAALYEGLRDGAIDCIASDHSPHSLADKNQELPAAPFGVIGFETLLPLLLGPIAERLGIELPALLRLVTNRPARVMRIPGGEIKIGGSADLTLWNPNAPTRIDSSQFFSKARNTPFQDWEVPGRVEMTFVAGRCVHRI